MFRVMIVSIALKIENMCLQLRVIRQMHREEKEKSQRRSLEVSSMSIQIEEMKRERDNIQSVLILPIEKAPTLRWLSRPFPKCFVFRSSKELKMN